MKSKLSYHCQVVAPRFLLGLALLTAGSASAQNFVKNPDFEEPLAPDNWTVVYAPVINSPLLNANGTLAGPNDFLVAGRSTMAHKDMVPGAWDGHDGLRNDWSKFGGHFAPNHTWVMHAYFKQVVSGLRPGFQYTASAWIVQFGAHQEAAQVYMETMGGLNGTVSKRTIYVTDNAQNNPAGWKMYAISNVVASSSGQIEIRLHYNKIVNVGDADSNYWEYRNQNAYFDHVCLMPALQPVFTPPYNILSFTRTNQEIALTWQTLMNNRYRLQASTNFSDPNSWVMLERELNVDTNFLATGTNFAFKTNVSSLFYYSPPGVKVPQYFDPETPLFFRIHSTSFQP